MAVGDEQTDPAPPPDGAALGALAGVWPKLAADWRMKQLQYTWLRAVTGDHTDFWKVTEDGLDWAMEANGLDDPELRETLLALYWELPAYREVPEMLATLGDLLLHRDQPEDALRVYELAFAGEPRSIARVPLLNTSTSGTR